MGWLFDSGPSFNTSKSSSCFYNELYGYCGGCNQMNPKNYSSGFFSGYSYKCERTGGYYSWHERACSRVEYLDPGRVDCCERYRLFTGRRYHILTVICEVLGFGYNNRLITEIIALIDSVRSDKSKSREAIGYDEFGPEIANMIRCDQDKVELCNYLLYNYIVKIYSLIGYNKLDEAIEMYENMVRFLFYRYKNKDNYAEMINANQFENKKILIKNNINK